MPDDRAVLLGDERERLLFVAHGLDDPRLLVGTEREPLDLERSIPVARLLRPDERHYVVPVDPNPPSPRVDGGSSSTHAGRTSGTSTITS